MQLGLLVPNDRFLRKKWMSIAFTQFTDLSNSTNTDVMLQKTN